MAIIKIKVIPGASKNEIVGMWQDMVKIKVTAQPESGKANEACIELISDTLKIPKNRIHITKGLKHREKLVNIITENETELINQLLHSTNPN